MASVFFTTNQRPITARKLARKSYQKTDAQKSLFCASVFGSIRMRLIPESEWRELNPQGVSAPVVPKTTAFASFATLGPEAGNGKVWSLAAA